MGSGPSPTPPDPNQPSASPPNQAWSAKTTRRVPVQTPMFDGTPDFTKPFPFGMRLNRTWIKFWEQLNEIGGSGGGEGPFHRTLLLKNTTVGDDIADRVPLYGPVPGVAHTIILVRAVLRLAITADLTVQIRNVSSGGTVVVGSFTVPAATAVNTIVDFTSFTTADVDDASSFIFDVTASDGSTDPAGVASFTIEWQP